MKCDPTLLIFYTGLWGIFRQDVDVVMIGEMRQPETMSTAVTAAETGHLVFSTLHTNSASQTVERIIDSFPASQQNQIRMQLAGSLIGIFLNVLFRRFLADWCQRMSCSSTIRLLLTLFVTNELMKLIR